MPVLAKGVTIGLLVLFPVAWLAPLAEAGFAMPLFGGERISILSGVLELAKSDIFLCAVVAVFAVLIPYMKAVLLVGAQFGHLGHPEFWLKILNAAGKLSMADVFLIAIYVVLIKGIGFGDIEVRWGLYLFTMLVLASIWATWATARMLRSGADHG